MSRIPLLLGFAFLVGTKLTATPALDAHAPHAANPILPGYYADPSLLQADGKIYIYATLDPWGDKTLGCWESSDWKNWTYRGLNWPTKAACTSPTSRIGMVWAPSVLRGTDGKFHMVASVGNEVWAGVADHPLGPWRNALGDRPLIPGDFRPGFHMIDAELFLDDDGQAWLYWGSGMNWKNGKCWAVKLKPDMTTFDGEVHDVTPAHYFEAPFMVKHGGRYYLMYSAGKTTEDTYQVHYAIGDTPLGPFMEATNSPVLVTDAAKNVISPGHHAVFTKDSESYILYHRQSVPFDPKFIGRQVCADRMVFTKDGLIEKVVPTHTDPAFAQGRSGKPLAATATASSQAGEIHAPAATLDDNYATRWAAAADDSGAWLQLDFGHPLKIARQEIRPEYAWKPYRFTVQFSDDGRQWQTLEDFTATPASGSPIVVTKAVTARYLRLLFSPEMKGKDVSVFEWLTFETAD